MLLFYLLDRETGASTGTHVKLTEINRDGRIPSQVAINKLNKTLGYIGLYRRV